jgi:hypothetical protein
MAGDVNINPAAVNASFNAVTSVPGIKFPDGIDIAMLLITPPDASDTQKQVFP